MRTGTLVTGEHLEGSSVTGQRLGVGQQELEAVTTAPGAGGLHVAVLVWHGHGGRGAVAGPHLARRPDARVPVVGAAGGNIRHVGLVLTQHSNRNKAELLIRASNKP